MIERAVMSLWTGPRRYLQAGGLALWALSALHLSRRFRELALVTDGRGMELLVERLGLPFTDVELMPKTAPWTALTNVWALGKLYAVAHEVKPFLHFDADVLVTGRLPERILRAQVTFERPVCHLGDPCESVYRNLALPRTWEEALVAGKRSQWGCGLMGGTDAVRLSTWAMSALRVAETNAELLKNRHGSKASIFLEQWSAARAFSVGDVEPLFRREHPDSRDEAWDIYRHLGGRSKVEARNIERIEDALEREWTGQLAKCRALEAELIEGKEIETQW